MRMALTLALAAATAIPGTAQTRPRGRDLGIPFTGRTGPLNAITDVAGVAVGHVTLIEGDGKLIPGKVRFGQASLRFSRARAATGILYSRRRSTRTAMAT
jgi:hypothetical protein